ncbi:PadR family transcriptional regulator [Conexibacter sp. JD483]|uniref:PadR family transcriptional regulator n=1 Tax=unclassified Conexibacter TaxID=2627773 RepID=UPI0027191A28|nr:MULTISPECIES: PadR family transcriptional regulator [unclassified Conexibacter]MDO8188763.1 PadR family transcriptional regulator [Conexibacter sp. CPCC 205706]MDO8201726.1 PadR family transcriptional regulator [Conexibacter sp. CPCC 205762]MDR9371387.1 PadR family transcriptional regulator [Conexibacter sp. JD483]
MSMKYAVLGMLIERRGYGYDLANRLQRRLGPGFRAAYGAVYVSLDQLAKEELVAESKRVQVGRQVKVYYAATPAGEERFRAWMREAPSREPLRGELYLKLAVAQGADLSLLRDELERLERECLRDIEAQTALIAARDGGGADVRWEEAVRWLADSAVIERLHSDLRWIRMAVRTVASVTDDGSVSRDALARAAEYAAAA